MKIKILETPNSRVAGGSKKDGGELLQHGEGDWLDPNYLSSANILQRRREDYSGKINQNIMGLESSSRINDFGTGYQLPEIPDFVRYQGQEQTQPTAQQVQPTAQQAQPAVGEPNNGMNPLFFNRYQHLKRDREIGPQDTQQSNNDLGFTQPDQKQYNPTLSPLGHILSGIGGLADYSAMKKARPEDVNLGRVGAERVDYAPERIALARDAANARAINTTNARGMGMNAGATMANTAVANTGVNRLLGQERAKSLMMEENTNAQLQQEANMMNAQIGMQEGIYNNQQSNAYNAQLASMNPLGNLSRTAASYFADNAAYGQGYDTLKMLAPNAELYGPDKNKFLNFLAQRGTQVRFKDK